MSPPARREFVRVSATALGGLWVGRFARLDLASASQEPAQLTAFVRIEPANRIVIGARGCEIGQGVRTSLPMLIAEELDVPWALVTVEQLPYSLLAVDAPPGVRPRYGPQGAGGSTSIPDGWQDLRMAGAQARWLLREAAARRWSVEPDSLRTAGGQIHHPDGRAVDYSAVAVEASRLSPPAQVTLKTPAQYRLLGTRVPTVDAREIVTGSATYGIDAQMPGHLVAVIERCPYFDGSIRSVDDAAARAIPGVVDVVPISGHAPGEDIRHNLAAGVAVVARDTWSAMRGRQALRVEWTPGPWVDDSSEALRQRALARLQEPGEVVRRDGAPSAARAEAGTRVIEAQYEVPVLAHATMEPPNCTVVVTDREAHVVASVQSPGDVSRLVAELTGLPRLAIRIDLPRSGGGFGRRLRSDYVAEAVKVAQRVKAPVKVVWTREDDLAHDFFRPFGVHGMSAVVDGGRLTSWRHHVVATPRKRRDPGMREASVWTGTCDPDNYPAGMVPNYESAFSAVEFGFAPGWWRAPLHTFGAFATESFLDEVAHAMGRDPVALRLELLGAPRELPYRDHGGPVFDTGRLAGVLQEAAQRIGWGTLPLAPRGRGIACHFTFGGYAAHAMEVSVTDGEVHIHRCVCVADVGQPVNLAGLEAQLMGGTIDGISTALRLEVTWANGRVQQRNFPSYPLLRLAEAPDVEVHIMPSQRAPSGAGEMGIPSAIPALTNAMAAATGRRIRRLPVGRQLG